MNWDRKSVLNQTAQQGTTESGGPDAGDAATAVAETRGLKRDRRRRRRRSCWRF